MVNNEIDKMNIIEIIKFILKFDIFSNGIKFKKIYNNYR